MISINHFSFSYNKSPLFNDFSLHINQGAFCAIIGPNGSGKTTLIKAIANLIDFNNGSITINKHNIHNLTHKELAKLIAYVPQRQDIIFDFSVYDTVMMGRNPHQNRWEFDDKNEHQLIEEILVKTQLTSLKNRMLSKLSGGEMQRVLIARAMAQQPPILLLDEPISNLDVAHQFQIMEILTDLNKIEHTTIIIVIHDLNMALQYCTSTLLLKNGSTQYYDATDKVLTPDHIKTVFDLGDNFHISPSGLITKK